MRKFKITLILLFSVAILTFSQEEPTLYYETPIFKPGINFEYLLRKIETEDNETSSLKTYIISLQADSEINERITLNFWIGGIFSIYDNMIFRRIPFSLKLTKDSGTIYGFVAGGGFDVKITEYEDINFSFFGKINYCFGINKEWDIPGLIVTGKANGKSNWGRVYLGPKVTYSVSESINPYGGIVFDYLFGKFNMEETISTLEATEGKKFHAKTLFGILIGSLIKLSDSIEMSGGIIIYPAGENINIFGGLKYSF
jgi:hypothetical protein